MSERSRATHRCTEQGGLRESAWPVAAPSNRSDLVNQEKCGQEMGRGLEITQYRKQDAKPWSPSDMLFR